MANSVEQQFPRPLSEREQAILDFLLSLDGPGVAALRAQAATAQVTSRCTCGCATINLSVDPSRSAVSSIRQSPAIEASTLERNEVAKCYELIVFVDEGWLSGVEIAYYDQPPAEFPPPEAFEPPRLRFG